MGLWTTLFSTKPKHEPVAPPALAQLRLQVFRTECVTIQVLKKSSPGLFPVRPLAHGLVEALVEHTSTGERMVPREALGSLGKSEDELFSLARSQSALHMVNKIKMQSIDGGIQVYASNDFYLSGNMLEAFARAKERYGILFAPVSSHHWCVHMVQAASLPPIVAMLALVADGVQKMMKVGDHEALTGALYWYRANGVIELLEVTGEGAELRATSSELAAAMDDAFRQHMRG